MSIKTHCPKCEKTYELDDTLDGKKAKCQQCEHVFEIRSDSTPKQETKAQDIPDFETIHIKPHKTSFILFNGFVFFFAVAAIIALLIGMFITVALMVAGVCLFGVAISYWLTNIKYKKEKYSITGNKVIYDSGSLFSDNSVELKLDKVSIVYSSLPFIQYKLFKTGNIVLQSAGSAGSEIFLSQIENTAWVYKTIQEAMKRNGFNLNQDELVQEAKPHSLGIIGEVFWMLVWSLIALFYILASLGSEIDGVSGYFSIISIVYGIFVISYAVLKFMDLKRRKYDIYKDTITYKEWFLSKHAAFIPMENVADIENKQSFFSKIFGLHDIIVSCQWESNQVVFKNMTQGEKMIKNIKFLKDNIIPREKVVSSNKQVSNDSVVGYVDKTETPLNYNKELKMELKMNFLRTTIGLIISAAIAIIWVSLFEPAFIFSILPFVIIVMVWKVISIIFTTFIVESSSIEKKFHFLSNNHTSFSVEKITSVIIQKNLLDTLMNTCSIRFYSIGSQTPITFKNIKQSPTLESDILAKVGINNGKQDEVIQTLEANFNFMDYFKSSIGAGIFFTILMILWATGGIIAASITEFGWIILGSLGWVFGFILLLFAIKYIYNVVFYSSQRYIREIRENHVFSRSGIIFIDRKYSLLRHIKWIKTTKYPLSVNGNISLNIAWEEKVAEQKTKKITIFSLLQWSDAVWGIVSSNTFNAKYIQNIFNTHDSVDSILNLAPINNEVLETAKQDIWNTILGLVILFVILSVFTMWFALIPGLIIIAITIWMIKVKYYNFEKDRVLFGSGIIYKKRHSILYRKFNFIDKNQGMVNKIFKNGNVWVYTLWSWEKEMWIKDIDNYTAIYDLLKTD